jgi:aminomuconate-semialdehyde/2-hydroxymuconate-6-semialdehyde dehydrogenase
VYVERPIFDKFVAALKVKAEGMKIGRPEEEGTVLGPLISHEHQQKVLSYMKKAVDEGATVVTGGGIPKMPKELAEGAWIQPTVWTGLPETATVVQEEIFGPCCHVQPFDREDEAVRMANDTRYGLATTVWTSNLGRRIASRPRSTPASAGSTAGSCATCAPRSAAPRIRGSAAKAACIRWSSTPSYGTYA